MQLAIPISILKWVFAALLIGFGASKLIKTRHPRWVGMRVGFRDLTIWSFLMASAHGAGLMLVPVLLLLPHAHPAPAVHTVARPMTAPMAGMPANCAMLTAVPPPAPHPVSTAALLWPPVAAVALHTLSHLLVAGIVALVVYEKLGLSLLRRSWFNLDALWAGALIVAGLMAALL